MKRAAQYLLGFGLIGYAATGPVSITAGNITLLCALAAAIPLWLMRQEAPYVRRVSIAVVVYLAVKLLTGALALDPDKGLREFTHFWPLLLVWVIPLAYRLGPRRTLLLRVFAVSVTLVGLYAVWQHFFGVEYWSGGLLPESNGRFPARAFFDNQQTWAGYSLAAALFFGVLAARPARDRWLYLAAGVTALLGNIATASRGPLLGVAAGIVLLLVAGKRTRRFGLAALALVLVVVLLAPGMRVRLAMMESRALNPDVDISRVFIWQTAWAVGASRPLLGVGPGNFRENYDRHKSRPDAHSFGHAHNEWLHEWATSGLLGVLAYTYLLAAVGWVLWRRRGGASGAALAALAAWAGLAVASLVQCHFSDEEVLMCIMFIASLGLLPEPAAAETENEGLPS